MSSMTIRAGAARDVRILVPFVVLVLSGAVQAALTDGLISHLRFDETSGWLASDSTGNGHTGAVSTNKRWTNGMIGGALGFSAGDDRVMLSKYVDLGGDWTIAVWFTTPLPNTGGWHTLTRAQYDGDDHQIMVDSSLNLGAFDNATGAGFRPCGYNLGGLSDGWHHIAAVGSGTTTAFYIDGSSVGVSDRKSAGNIYCIGNFQCGGQRFADALDDVRVYDRALGAAEVDELYLDAFTVTVTISALDSVAHEAGPDTGSIRVSRRWGLGASLQVALNFAGSTAGAADYTSAPDISGGSLQIPAGQEYVDVLITPLSDGDDTEPNENLIVTIDDASGIYRSGSDDTAVVTIAAETAVTIEALDGAAAESGPDTGTFRIARTLNLAAALDVSVSLAGSTAGSADYTSVPDISGGSIQIPAGQTYVDVVITPLGDSLHSELDETVVATVAAAAGYFASAQDTATVTIANYAPAAIEGMVLLTGAPPSDPGPLVLHNLSTGVSTTIIADNVRGPSFSPDGLKVAFGKSGKICTASIDGSNVVELADCGVDYVSTNWTMDGYIYWSQADNYIYRVSDTGGSTEIVLDNGHTVWVLGMSRDGTRAAWTSQQGEGPGNVVSANYGVTADLTTTPPTITRVDADNNYVMNGCQTDVTGDGRLVTSLQTGHHICHLWNWPGGETMDRGVLTPIVWFMNHRLPHYADGYILYVLDGGDYRCVVHRLSDDSIWDVGTQSRVWDMYTEVPTVDPDAVTIESFTATPTSITLGTASTLSWQTTNAQSVSIDSGVGAVTASGTTDVSPASTTTYTLTAQGTGGPMTRQVTVTVETGGVVDPSAPDRWWKFDDGSGLTASDSSGNSVHGALRNMSGAEWTTGTAAGALAFDGVDDYVAIPDNALPTAGYYDDGDFTVAFWMKIAGDAQMSLVCRSTESASSWSDARMIRIRKDASGPMVLESYVWDGTSEFATGTTALQTDTWYHVVGVFDSGAGEDGVRIYLNGSLESAVWFGSPGGYPQDSWFIGRELDDPDVKYYGPFDGVIDDLRVYHSILTDQEIAQLSSGTSTSAPQVLITSPSNDEHVYDTVSVAGTAGGDAAVASVEVSVSGGAFQSAVGNAQWSVWTYSFDAALLLDGEHTLTARVTDVSGGVSTTTITIVVDPSATSVPVIAVSAPASGDVWYVGTSRIIEFTAANLPIVVMYYSTDGGDNWSILSGNIELGIPTWGAYPWTVPDEPSMNCLVRIQGYNAEVPTSSGTFEIRAVTDGDGDGMDDEWELATFGDMLHDQTTNADGDGATDYEEFRTGTDPLVADGGGALQHDGSAPGCFAAARPPSGPTGSALSLAALLCGAFMLRANRKRSATVGKVV